MDIIIPESEKQYENDFKLEDIAIASIWAKEAIVNQRKKINEIIFSGMQDEQIAIELPFELFPEIIKEMYERGWQKNNGNCYQPIWFSEPSAQLQIKDETDKVVSAQTFYESTMKNQLLVLKEKIERASEDGLAVIRLNFPLYKVIAKELNIKGWTTDVYSSYQNPFSIEPSTLIRVKQ